MRFRTIFLITFNFLFIHCAYSQSYVALSTGISKDLNNRKSPFYHIPVSLQWKPFRKSTFFVEADEHLPFSRPGTADAYSLYPGLPSHIILSEKVRPYLFTLTFGFGIRLYTDKKNNNFSLQLGLGVTSQHFRVYYKNYDKVNYEILNPDVNSDSSGLMTSMALLYTFHRSRQDMFLMLHLQSGPLVFPDSHYTMTYKLNTPLQLTFGYKLFYNKRK